jgi:hypothetical protein
MPDLGLLMVEGAIRREKQTPFRPLTTSTFFTGLRTNRSPFTGPFSRYETRFLGGRADTLIGGSNMELTNYATIARRPGFYQWSTATLIGTIQNFYTLKKEDATVVTIVDTSSKVYKVTPTTAYLLFAKPTVNGITGGESTFVGVGDFIYWGDGQEQLKWNDTLVQPPAAPTVSYEAAGTLPATTYYIQITYVNRYNYFGTYGETTPSPEISIAVPANNLLIVYPPPVQSGASGWFLYVGTTSGGEKQQPNGPFPMGAGYGPVPPNFWLEPFTGISTSGAAPPTTNNAQYTTKWGIVAPSTAPTFTNTNLSTLTTHNITGVTLNGSTGYISTTVGGPTVQRDDGNGNMSAQSLAILFKTTAASPGVFISYETNATGDSNTHEDTLFYMDGSGHIVFTLYDTQANKWQVIQTANTYNNGQWHWAVCTISTTGGNANLKVTLYVDGQQEAYTSALMQGDDIVGFNGFWRIGDGGGPAAPNPPTGSSPAYFNGTLSHAAIWHSKGGVQNNPWAVLTPAQVSSFWNDLISNGQTAFETDIANSLVTWFWKLTETSGTTAADSADSDPGIYEGGFTLDQSTAFFGSWQALTSYSLGAVIIDSNGNLQQVTTAGTSGSTQPVWNTSINGTTIDGTIVWTNLGPQSLSPVSTQGYIYAYSFKNSLTGHVSTASPLSLPTGPQTASSFTLIGQGSLDAQVDQIEIYRTLDGGSLLYFLADIPAPNPTSLGSPGFWIYIDAIPDSGLNTLITAPIDHQNDPPLLGSQYPVYHLQRIWVAVGNKLYFSAGPDIEVGNPNEAFPPVNVFVFQSPIFRMVPIGNGLLVFTRDNIWIIEGTTTAAFYPNIYLPRLGLSSYNCLDYSGSDIFLYTSDRQFINISPSSISQMGFAIGDKLAASFDPTSSWVQIHIQGQDAGVYMADGSTGWYRVNPNQPPEGGPAWSPFATVTGGIGPIYSAETSPGKYQLLMGQGSTIGTRDDTGAIFTDFGTAYTCSVQIGSIVLASPGQLAEVDSLTLELFNVGTLPTPGVRLNEIGGSFINLTNHVSDPPVLPDSATLISKRWYLTQQQNAVVLRHMQTQVSFIAENFKNELLTLSIYGVLMLLE